MFVERTFDQGIDSIWNRINRGVSVFHLKHIIEFYTSCHAFAALQKLWKDIKHEYEGGDEDE